MVFISLKYEQMSFEINWRDVVSVNSSIVWKIEFIDFFRLLRVVCVFMAKERVRGWCWLDSPWTILRHQIAKAVVLTCTQSVCWSFCPDKMPTGKPVWVYTCFLRIFYGLIASNPWSGGNPWLLSSKWSAWEFAPSTLTKQFWSKSFAGKRPRSRLLARPCHRPMYHILSIHMRNAHCGCMSSASLESCFLIDSNWHKSHSRFRSIFSSLSSHRWSNLPVPTVWAAHVRTTTLRSRIRTTAATTCTRLLWNGRSVYWSARFRVWIRTTEISGEWLAHRQQHPECGDGKQLGRICRQKYSSGVRPKSLRNPFRSTFVHVWTDCALLIQVSGTTFVRLFTRKLHLN